MGAWSRWSRHSPSRERFKGVTGKHRVDDVRTKYGEAKRGWIYGSGTWMSVPGYFWAIGGANVSRGWVLLLVFDVWWNN